MEHSQKPLAIDLFTGLHGWGEGLIAEGFRVVGFDIEDMCGQFSVPRHPDIQLVLQDVLTLHGSQFRDAALIVASPPCQSFSYMAMPWTLAKEKARRLRQDADDRKRLTALFDACFRIQREACEAAGRHIPLVVENVKGAQEWVGRSRWNFGSFHLWGDVPALMPMTPGQKEVSRNPVHGLAEAERERERERHEEQGPGRLRAQPSAGVRLEEAAHVEQGQGSQGGVSDDCENPARAVEAYRPNLLSEGIKQHGSGREWFAGDGKISRMTSSKSPARKYASAMIAKIPLTLSRHIAASWKPRSTSKAAEQWAEERRP